MAWQARRKTVGTRADFYLGRGERAIWLGSISLNAAPGRLAEGRDAPRVLATRSPHVFRAAAQAIIRKSLVNGDAWSAGQGAAWPWPWPTSEQTDYAYAWDNQCVLHDDCLEHKVLAKRCHGRPCVWISHFGGAWVTYTTFATRIKIDVEEEWFGPGKGASFPTMTPNKARNDIRPNTRMTQPLLRSALLPPLHTTRGL